MDGRIGSVQTHRFVVVDASVNEMERWRWYVSVVFFTEVVVRFYNGRKKSSIKEWQWFVNTYARGVRCC